MSLGISNFFSCLVLSGVVAFFVFPWGCTRQRHQLRCPSIITEIPDWNLDPEITRLVFMRVVSFNLTYAGHVTYLEIRRTDLECNNFADWPVDVMLNGHRCNVTTAETLVSHNTTNYTYTTSNTSQSETTTKHEQKATTTHEQKTTTTHEQKITTSLEQKITSTTLGLSTRKPFPRPLSHTSSTTTTITDTTTTNWPTSTHPPLSAESNVTVMVVLIIIVVTGSAVFVLVIVTRWVRKIRNIVREDNTMDNLSELLSHMSLESSSFDRNSYETTRRRH